MSKKAPEISVILPTYKRPHLLPDAIQTVLRQTFQDFEIIIINDASQDNTKEIVKKFNDARIHYVEHKKNKGGSAARNSGIKKAKGKYIAFLDDDDKWFPEKLKKQLAKLKSCPPNVGLVYSWSEIRIGPDKELLKVNRPAMRGNLQGEFLECQKIGGIPVLIRKKCFDKIGLFDETLAAAQDWDMWKRFSEHYHFDYVPEVLTKVYLHDNQLSSSLETLIKGRTQMVEKYLDEFMLHPEVLVIHYKRLGKLHALNGTWKLSYDWFRKAFILNRQEIFKIIGWLVVEYPHAKLIARAGQFKKYFMRDVQ